LHFSTIHFNITWVSFFQLVLSSSYFNQKCT
jgi:hypothetical protein